MQTQVLFEHPLNEKMRTWLRIEFLIQQLTVNLPIVDHAGALHFFRNVSELLDVFERGEVRTELLKELDRQQRLQSQTSSLRGRSRAPWARPPCPQLPWRYAAHACSRF